MKIFLNGEEKEINKPLSVAELLESFRIDHRKVAVEKNLEIIPKSTYSEELVNEGDKVEIVHFIGGG